MTVVAATPYHPNVQPVLSAEQIREIDRLTVENYHTSSLLLMEAASGACMTAIRERLDNDLLSKKALILCGKGNNGGDGAALARAMSRVGMHCSVVLFGKLSDTSGDARTNFESVSRLASFEAGSPESPAPLTLVECESVNDWEKIAKPRRAFDVIVDALFGTGLTRPLEGVFLKVIEHLAMLREARDRVAGTCPVVLSIDVPSGLNADKAKPIGPAVKADLTVTFTAAKPANVLPPASEFGGELIVADIGSPSSLIEAARPWLFLTEAEDARQWLVSTRYTPDSYKNTHGHVLIAAGSRGYSGAAALCGNATIRAGAGLVTVATLASAQSAVAGSAMPEVITTALAETDRGAISDEAATYFLQLAEKATVVALGPGLTSDDERTRRFVHSVLDRRTKPCVIDADGLNSLAPWPGGLSGSDQLPLVLTPHPGEMLRLMGAQDKSALDDRVAAARQFATAHHVLLLLKGSRSLIATPDGRVFVNSTGNAGLGTAGAGDTLTGLISGFLAQAYATLEDRADPVAATVAALYVGGLAGDFAAKKLGMRTMVASDLREHFSDAIRFLDPRGEQP
ncbi:MAG TPA: NAD(P)H-hydrate dehydratase [Pyrinomonadaceae bacterium]|nr:NAD(P)H-hydrate dehydratase [Pyrinomonadaceae bacterium]